MSMQENAFTKKLREILKDFGLPRLIIAGFLVVLFITAPFVGVSLSATLKDISNRFGQNMLLTLAMVPMILSGAGLNFGLSLGVISGLLGSTMAMQMGLTGWAGLFGATFAWRAKQAGKSYVHVNHVAHSSLHKSQHGVGLRR